MKKIVWILVALISFCLAEEPPVDVIPVEPYPGETEVSTTHPIMFEVHSDYLIDLDTISSYCYYWCSEEGRYEKTLYTTEVDIEGFTVTPRHDDYEVVCSFHHPHHDFPENMVIYFVVEAGIQNYDGKILDSDVVWTFTTEGGVDIEGVSWGALKAALL